MGVMTASAQQLPPPQDNLQKTTPLTEGGDAPLTVEVLSDTAGVDLNPYMRQALGSISKTWTSLYPEEARSSQPNQGWSVIRIRIRPDGQIDAMRLDGSSHDYAINRASWASITAVKQFPPLPAAMGSKPLELRLHFNAIAKPQ